MSFIKGANVASAYDCKVAVEVVLSKVLPVDLARNLAEKTYDLVAEYTRNGLDKAGQDVANREFDEMCGVKIEGKPKQSATLRRDIKGARLRTSYKAVNSRPYSVEH